MRYRVKVPEQYQKYLDDYKDYITHDRSLSGPTVSGYIYCISRFLIFLNFDPAIVTSKDIRDMLKYLGARGMRNSSMASYICAFRSFYNWMHYTQKNEFTTDVSFYLNKILRTSNDNQLTQVPTIAEADRVRECMIAHKTAYAFHKEASEYKYILRDLAIIEMFRSTSARSSELKGIRLIDINFEERTVLIKKGKGNKQRICLFGDTAKDAVNDYVTTWGLDQDCQLFSITRFNLLYQVVKRWAVRSGINPDLHPHSWRHYHVTKSLRDGVPLHLVSIQAGHANPMTTLKYTHLDIEHRREQYSISDTQK